MDWFSIFDISTIRFLSPPFSLSHTYTWSLLPIFHIHTRDIISLSYTRTHTHIHTNTRVLVYSSHHTTTTDSHTNCINNKWCMTLFNILDHQWSSCKLHDSFQSGYLWEISYYRPTKRSSGCPLKMFFSEQLCCSTIVLWKCVACVCVCMRSVIFFDFWFFDFRFVIGFLYFSIFIFYILYFRIFNLLIFDY